MPGVATSCLILEKGGMADALVYEYKKEYDSASALLFKVIRYHKSPAVSFFIYQSYRPREVSAWVQRRR